MSIFIFFENLPKIRALALFECGARCITGMCYIVSMQMPYLWSPGVLGSDAGVGWALMIQDKLLPHC